MVGSELTPDIEEMAGIIVAFMVIEFHKPTQTSGEIGVVL